MVALPILALLIGWPFLQSTVLFNSKQDTSNSIQVLSFNAQFFRQPKAYSKFSTEMIQWVTNDTSAIKCLQEYSTNPQLEPLDASGQMRQKGYRGFTYLARVGDWDNNPGMAIFSKFNILDSGIVFHSNSTHNAAIFADLDIHGKTIRVYNVHLASMSLDLHKNSGFAKIFIIIKKLKYGALKRNNQIKELIAHTRSSPYPYIICGDFNETPYSYAYRQLKNEYENTFEQTGNGFGFTFNDFPYLLRIDHQFYSSDIHAVDYHVHRTMDISNHFPTHGYYQIE
jgi:endonuclease/exonuclease/phosphatase family metal-dependent hydrolase